MVVDSRVCDTNQKPRAILKRVSKLESSPCIYRRGESFIFESRKSQAIGKIIKFNNRSFRVASECVDIKKNPINQKLYNIYILDEV